MTHHYDRTTGRSYATCTFCGYEGVVPDEVTKSATGGWACTDRAACDEREEREHQARMHEPRQTR